MSEPDPHIPAPPPESDAKRRSRLRWITLGEAIAVAAVLISGLGLYNSWQDRRSAETERTAAARKASNPVPIVLRATPVDDGARLDIVSVRDDQTIQAQTIAFPTTLDISPVDTTGNSRIEAAWISTALKQARKAGGKPEETAGDERLPILITTRFLDGGEMRTETATYDLGYDVKSRFLLGGDVRLRGLSLLARGPGANGQKRIDAIWSARSKK